MSPDPSSRSPSALLHYAYSAMVLWLAACLMMPEHHNWNCAPKTHAFSWCFLCCFLRYFIAMKVTNRWHTFYGAKFEQASYRDLNSGPYVCTISNLPDHLSPQSRFYSSKKLGGAEKFLAWVLESHRKLAGWLESGPYMPSLDFYPLAIVLAWFQFLVPSMCLRRDMTYTAKLTN